MCWNWKRCLVPCMSASPSLFLLVLLVVLLLLLLVVFLLLLLLAYECVGTGKDALYHTCPLLILFLHLVLLVVFLLFLLLLLHLLLLLQHTKTLIHPPAPFLFATPPPSSSCVSNPSLILFR